MMAAIDPRCYALAEYFLSEYQDVEEQDKRELAIQIQHVCDDYLSLFDADEREI